MKSMRADLRDRQTVIQLTHDLAHGGGELLG